MDALSQLLEAVQLQGQLYCRSELSAPWGVAIERAPAAVFHLVEQGAGWLQLEEVGQPIALAPGDLVLIPHGTPHQLGSAPAEQVTLRLRVDAAPAEHAQVRLGGDGAEAIILCGTFAAGAGVAAPLLAGLPPCIHLRPAAGEQTVELRATLLLLVAEANLPRPGSATVIRRLGDVLFVQIVRAWLAQTPAAGGWLRALHDPAIGKALAAMHGEPGAAWTLETLAALAGLSRSGFAARFSTLVGEPPGRYLARWRMALATQRLQRERVSIAALADELGYDSEGAFNRAFRRLLGLAPGAYRRQQSKAISRFDGDTRA